MRRGIGIGFLALALSGLASPTRADLIVQIGSTAIAQGGTGSIDVSLISDASRTNPDLLNFYGFTLVITGPNNLQFSSSQTFAYLSSSQYVFAGDSFAQSSSSPGGAVTTSVYSNDTFVGTDSTTSGDPVSLSSANTPLLLARLQLDATITNIGDVYAVSLVPPSGNGSMNSSDQTFFDVFDFNTGGETSAVPFTSTAGTVTITGGVVPEPASIVSSLTAMVLVAGFHGVRRLRRAKGQAA